MTQQSLIVRLREYEKALEDGNEMLRMTHARSNPKVVASDAALTDLRDLIREAEGQEDVTRIEDWPLKDGNLRPLYTALGEKP